MKNIFSSPNGLTRILQVKLNQLDAKLDVISKNVLYITYKVDKISTYQKTLDSNEYYEEKQDGSTDNNPESA